MVLQISALESNFTGIYLTRYTGRKFAACCSRPGMLQLTSLSLEVLPKS